LNRPVNSLPPEEKNDHTHPCRKGGRPSGDQRGHGSIKGRRNGDEPKEQRRFINIHFSIQVRNHPLPRPDHLPCDFCVPKIIVIFETFVPEVKKENETTDNDETANDPSFSRSPFLHIIFLLSGVRERCYFSSCK
jgi:hypothetical protein